MAPDMKGQRSSHSTLHDRTTLDVAVMAFGMRLTYNYLLQTPRFRGQKGRLHQVGSLGSRVRFS